MIIGCRDHHDTKMRIWCVRKKKRNSPLTSIQMFRTLIIHNLQTHDIVNHIQICELYCLHLMIFFLFSSFACHHVDRSNSVCDRKREKSIQRLDRFCSFLPIVLRNQCKRQRSIETSILYWLFFLERKQREVNAVSMYIFLLKSSFFAFSHWNIHKKRQHLLTDQEQSIMANIESELSVSRSPIYCLIKPLPLPTKEKKVDLVDSIEFWWVLTNSIS